MEVTYTVGVKGKFWPFYINYKVKTHQLETRIAWKHRYKDVEGQDKVEVVLRDIEPRLVLTLADDSLVVIGAIEDKVWKVYPDFNQAIDTLTRAREAQKPWVEESAAKRPTGDNTTSPLSDQSLEQIYQAMPGTPQTLQ